MPARNDVIIVIVVGRDTQDQYMFVKSMIYMLIEFSIN